MGELKKKSPFPKRLWSIVFWLFALGNILAALFGIFSIFLFFLVVFGTAGALYRITNPIFPRVRTIILPVVLLIISGELILRTRGGLDSYTEAMGSWSYTSPYHNLTYAGKSWVHNRTPNSTKTENRGEYDYRLVTNSDGLRDIMRPIKKDKGVYRIIALGASLTEGLGVSSLDKTWVKILEHNLNDELTGSQIEVFNGGVADSDPFFELVLLKDKLLKYKPDLVIVSVDMSDLVDVYVRGGNERFRKDSTVTFKRGPWYEPLFGMSYLARLYVFRVMEEDWLFRTAEEQADAAERSQLLIYRCLEEFQLLAEKEKFQLMVLLQPLEVEIQSKEYNLTYLGDLLKRNPDIYTYDAWQDLIAVEPGLKLYWPRNRHFTETGNAIFATLLQKELIRKQILN